MNFDKNVKCYEEILTDEEIVDISKIIREFEKGKITYLEVQDLFSNMNIKLVPNIIDPTNFKTIRQVEELKSRIENKTLQSKDINGYVISSERFQNVLFRYDRPAIEKLAESGDEEAIKTLKGLKEWEEYFSNKQAELQMEFEELKRRFPMR